ncbi:XylR family transcriptional regulator [Luteolibacter sp. LG18]|uniref:XylR family transcriptional regulator n=1 Tax=Luteolibacter sp. LG18 TaxID=2819286 RepID=UPI002B315AAE|nr:XylR family transcriptional regulator [Luteolibacter sp. LG18]
MLDDVSLPRRFRVGVRLPEWSTGFSFRIFAGLTDFQRQNAPFQLFFNQPSGGDLPATVIDETWDGDGLIVFRYTAEEGRAWKARGISVVNLSAEIPEGGPVFPRVTLDNAKVGAMAADHLAALGLRDFCYIHESTRRYSEARWKGFEEAVKAAGGRSHRIDIPVSAFPEDIRVRRIRETMRGPLSKLPRPCGIFTKDDIAAVWTITALAELGIRCPEEMPVLGVDDDIVFCHTTQPPLSSISYPGRHIGFEAAKLLHRMLSGEVPKGTDHHQAIAPAGVVSRESTRHVILKDPVVTKALAVIRREVPRTNIQVAEVARLCGVSRELLRQRFQDQLQYSPKDEIKRLRLRHLIEVLTTTDWTLEAIAENCGYSGAEEICRFIKRNTGKTTGEIRKAV